MSDLIGQEQRIAELLRSQLAAAPEAPIGLLDNLRLAARHRRRRRWALAAATGAVLLVICGAYAMPQLVSSSTTQPGGAHTSSTSQGTVVRDGRYVATDRLDDGALTITPSAVPPAPGTLAAAIAAFRSTALPHTGVGDVVVGFGNVSIAALGSSAIRDASELDSVWIVTYQDGAIFGCPANNIQIQRHQPVNLAFVYGHGAGISYVGRGGLCGDSGPPRVQYATQYVSVAWQLDGVARDGYQTIRYELPACASSSAVDANAASGNTMQVAVSAVIQMTGAPCRGSATTHTARLSSDNQLTHTPLGPQPGLFTVPAGYGFSYSTEK